MKSENFSSKFPLRAGGRFLADLHIHTCLSPCGDLEMSPRNIIQKAEEKGLDVIAITDHNSTRNVRTVWNWGKKQSFRNRADAEINERRSALPGLFS